jgi:hypothetical protein
VLTIQDASLLDVDLERRLLFMEHTDVVTDLPLETDVGDQAMAGLRIDSREVPGIGVAVGISILDVEEINEIEAMGKWHRIKSFDRIVSGIESFNAAKIMQRSVRSDLFAGVGRFAVGF